MQIKTGTMPYLGYHTAYRIVGDPNSKKTPLVLLHGGPGSTHNYFEVLDELAQRDGRMLIMYDQLGCGDSMVEGHPELWRSETWVNELIALRKHLGLERVYLLGQSWGGMLLLDYLCNYHPEGVEGIVLSSTLPASWMWGEEQSRMIRELPEQMQAAIRRAEETGVYDTPEAKAAEAEYMRRHAGDPPTEDSPECLRRPKRTGREAYVTAWGPNEYSPMGTLKDYDVTAQLGAITQPTLIISGGSDLCTPYIAKYMCDRIPNARWELFRTCRHSCFTEETEHYLRLLSAWLNEVENTPSR